MSKIDDVVVFVKDYDEIRTKGYIGKVRSIDDDGYIKDLYIRRYYPSTGKMSAKAKGVYVSPDFVAPYFAVGDIAKREDGNLVKIINNDDPLTLVARRYYPSSGKMSLKDNGRNYSPNELTKVDAMPDCENCEDAPDYSKTLGKIVLLAALHSLLDD